MMKLLYEQKQYEYYNIGSQPYDIKLTMDIKNDASVEEAIATFMKFLQVAGYSCLSKENVTRAIEEYFDGDYYS